MDKLQLAYNSLSIEDFLDEYEKLSMTNIYIKLYGVYEHDNPSETRPLPIVANEIIWKMLKAISVEEAVKMQFITEQDVLDVFAKNDPSHDWDTDQAILDEDREWRETPEPRPLLDIE